MKKKGLAILLCFTAALSVAGCGNKKGALEGTEISDSKEGTEAAGAVLNQYEFVYSDYVTLCDYSAVPVTLTQSYEVTDEDVEDFFKQWFEYNSPFYTADDTKTVIEEGDIVDVDYVGKLDGTAFDGGSAENQVIDVSGNCMADGSTGFIEGFTDGLMGASVGEIVDCDVTFPENYGNTDLAGKPVVFTFTVNAIQREMTIDEVDDSFAEKYAGQKTVEGMYDMIRENMETEAEQNKENQINTLIHTYLLENCTVEVPADYLADLFEAYRSSFIAQNCGGDESQLESYLNTNYGYTVEQAEEEWKTETEGQAKLEFIFQAIAEKEGIELDQEGFDTEINDMMTYYGLSDASTIYESYGYGDAVYGERYMKILYVSNSALEKIRETAVITTDIPEENEPGSEEGTDTQESETGTTEK